MRISYKLILVVSLLLIIDGFILTPIALSLPGTKEVNPIHNWGFNNFGLIYFYIAIPIQLFLLMVFFRGIEGVVDDLIYKYDNSEKIKKIYFLLFGSILIVGLIFTIINNLLIILSILN